MEHLGVAIWAALVSTTRFTWGPLIASSKFNYIETFIIAFIGGALGTFIYYYGAQFFFNWLRKRAIKKGKRKIFTKTNRKIVKVKQKFGLWGIAFLTPPILSIMIGTMVAYKFYKNKKSTIPVLLFSVLVYDVIYTAFYFGLKEVFLTWWNSL